MQGGAFSAPTRGGDVQRLTTRSGLCVHVRHALGPPVGTVLCVHGGLDGAASFTRLARRLGDVDVLAYDRRGYRDSRAVEVRAGLAVQCEDAREVVDAAARDDAAPLIVLGHSLGGLIALGTVADGGLGAAKAVVAFEPPYPWGRPDRGAAQPPIEVDPSKEAESFFRRIVGEAAWDRLGDDGRAQRRADGPALVEDLRVLRGPAPFDPATVSAPVVLAVSDGAPQRRRASIEGLAARLPVSRVVTLSGATHGAHLSNPDGVAAMVRAALGRAR